MNVNLWVGCGRLTRDAEASVTKKGTSMSKFRLAVNDRRNDDTLFLNVLCFGKMAESLNEHLRKGRLVSVTGKVKVDEYEDKNGAQRVQSASWQMRFHSGQMPEKAKREVHLLQRNMLLSK